MGSTRHDLRAEVTRSVTANGITLRCATYGKPTGEPLLMIMGIGTQLDGWDLAFCDGLVDAGFLVIRFDNRDVGLSDRIPGQPDIAAIRGGDLRTLPYTLADMAADAVGVLDALGIDQPTFSERPWAARSHSIWPSGGQTESSLFARSCRAPATRRSAAPTRSSSN